MAWACYWPALSGDFQLDDMPNLGGLAHVSDYDSALDFVLGGKAGPLGRPIALLTFAWQADSWQQGAAPFLKFNLLLHLLNALLVATCSLRLALSMRAEYSKAIAIAALAASAWVLMPLLATASLLVVQRMATLSASFVLLGLIGYLVARARIDERPRQALLGMSASLIGGTLLAVFSKESGLLLPVFALVLEATVLARPSALSTQRWRAWQAIFLFAPLAVILAYLAMHWSYGDSLVQRRGFGAGERLLTEARILWLYLFKAVLGLPDRLGIFQSSPAIARSLLQPLTLLATVTWALLLAAAIKWRRRYPIAALAVLWFLAGHLLESTVLPLELYFEHRNYLAIIGPLFALCSLIVFAAPRVRIAATSSLVIVILINAGCLYAFASYWGSPSAASRHWAMLYPDSVRAVATMGTYQLTEEGPLRTLRTIDEFVLRNPQHGYLRLQELNLLCRYQPDLDRGAVLAQLGRELPAVDFTYTAGNMLSQLLDTSVEIDCPDVRPETVAALAVMLHDNPRYVGDPTYNQFHEKLLAAIARFQGDMDAAFGHLRAAIEFQPSSELNMMMVTGLASVGNFDAAREFIDDAISAGPINPLGAVQWRRNLHGLKNYIDELEKVQQ
jgi:hypothetical protein